MSEAQAHIVPTRTYVGVLLALMFFLVLTIVMAFIDIDGWSHAHHLGSGWNTAIALTIAILKAILIVLIFMHLKYSTHLMWIFASAGVVWLMIMLTLTMTDYFTRNSTFAPSPKGEPTFLKSQQEVAAPSNRPADADFPANSGSYH